MTAHSESCPAAYQWAEKWLSADRFAPYLEACAGDADCAIELYEWNIRLGQVLMGDIAHFEVAFRNACDRAMCDAWGESWLTDPDSPARRPVMRHSSRGTLDANRINRKAVDDALRNLPADHVHGDLVASLTLGFWVHLGDRSRETIIWRTGLYRAWPKGTRRAELQKRLYGILRVRNRIAHNERLFIPKRPELSPSSADANTIELLRDLCPEAHDFLYCGNAKVTSVDRYLAENPAPVRVAL